MQVKVGRFENDNIGREKCKPLYAKQLCFVFFDALHHRKQLTCTPQAPIERFHHDGCMTAEFFRAYQEFWL